MAAIGNSLMKSHNSQILSRMLRLAIIRSCYLYRTTGQQMTENHIIILLLHCFLIQHIALINAT